MREKGLNRTQLQYLAIIAMVVDHTAWGFVEFYSPLGQLMHTFGRLTLPIMCFFIAEGYKHTSDLRRYIRRMATFAILTIIPFYVFFNEEYGYRQNIIFDLLLALLALSALENKKWSKATRVACVALLVVVSGIIGGWVIMPICYTLCFYYGDTFRKKATLFCFHTVLLVAVVSIGAYVNGNVYRFMQYDWDWYEWIYFLGFMLALIPLYFYNGEKGPKPIGGRYFFYLFYPSHFLVLTFIKYYMLDFSAQRIYIMLHVIALAIALGTMFYVLKAPSSRVQLAASIFVCFGVMYVFSFLTEITTYEVPGVYTATKLEYFSTLLCIIAMSYCVSEFCHIHIPSWIYAIELSFCIFLMYCIFTYEKNGLMYTGISINYDGLFPRMEIESYGPAFYAYIVFAFLVCVGAFAVGLWSIKKKGALERKRLANFLYAAIGMWLPFVFKATGIFGDYEIPAVGIAIAGLFVGRAIGKYGYLDSIELGFNNALNMGSEGVMIIDNAHSIIYHNEFIHQIFGEIDDYQDAYAVPKLKSVFQGEMRTMEVEEHKYEMRVEPLVENGVPQGQIMWIFDLTEHYKYLDAIEEEALTDPLTGLFNRRAFEKNVSAFYETDGVGTFVILDLDNFKHVNDTYGHQAGDEVLMALGNVIKRQPEAVWSGRIGGDEFCLFYQNEIRKDVIGSWAQSLIDDFNEELTHTNCGQVTSITVGMAVADPSAIEGKKLSYSKIYRNADRALYSAKEAGKKTYRIYKK